MNKVYDHIKVDKLREKAGLSQAAVARELGVSREAVSNWMSGESTPRPRHRTLLAALLGVTLADLGTTVATVREPVIAFRTKRNLKLKDDQREWIKRDVTWLERLEKRVEVGGLQEMLPWHRGEASEEEARTLAVSFRDRLGLSKQDTQVAGRDILTYLAARGVCIVPVYWGDCGQRINAMHVRFPESRINWLYIDLDSSLIDMRFWILHETAHMIRRRPHDADEQEEMFAEAFAAEVLFPTEQARDILPLLQDQAADHQAKVMLRLADARAISAVTIYRQVNHAIRQLELEPLELDGLIYQPARKRSRTTPNFNDLLFGGETPPAEQFIAQCAEQFSTPVFYLAAEEIREKNRGYGFVERIFQCSTQDAMALHEALREYGTTKDPA